MPAIRDQVFEREKKRYRNLIDTLPVAFRDIMERLSKNRNPSQQHCSFGFTGYQM